MTFRRQVPSPNTIATQGRGTGLDNQSSRLKAVKRFLGHTLENHPERVIVDSVFEGHVNGVPFASFMTNIARCAYQNPLQRDQNERAKLKLQNQYQCLAKCHHHTCGTIAS
jgi:orotate phosphoribosyltransferase-like protein